MDVGNTTQTTPPTTSAGMDHSEEMLAEVDEPPDELQWSPTKHHFGHIKANPSYLRRESLLTQQLHSETDHTDDDGGHMPTPPRTMSTQSTWSNPSTTSMTDLTSDDGHSVASPAISPPLGPTHSRNALPVSEHHLEPKVRIVGHDDVAPTENQNNPETSIEANLGRKRCISFACRSKQEPKPVQAPAPTPKQSESPPKRKCMLRFVCPTRAAAESKPVEKTQPKRAVSPAPLQRTSGDGKHRGSDSTTHTSPISVRKNSTSTNLSTTSTTPQASITVDTRRYSINSSDEDNDKDTSSFQEFGVSENEEWVQESTCHRSRLTVDDVLKKENVIRKTCEEVEEEAMEEEEGKEDEELEDELAAVADMDDDDGAEENDDYESDEGFHSDDEDGFASSDSENDEDSDYEWWRPGNASTAATSVENLDRLAIINSKHIVPSTSVDSATSAQLSHGSSKSSVRKAGQRHNQTRALPINRPVSPNLPDSTDFVCGTLDEDRPIEQAYINRKKLRTAAKHQPKPQDIDPTFPTSDPDMDEEDDDDVDEKADSEEDDLLHGDIEELHGKAKRSSPPPRIRTKSNFQTSVPSPKTRLHSPPPPPPMKRLTTRSPPPPIRRGFARSPPPRRLFSHSPRRTRSPAPLKRMTSPPNSPTDATGQLATAPQGLAGRPAPTHTASLPRGGPITLSKLAAIHSDDEDSDTPVAIEEPKRGAIDIVKGVEFKREWRKQKLYQKMCAKNAAKDSKPIKVKPGKGAERMREVGLQLQEYRGRAEHILSL